MYSNKVTLIPVLVLSILLLTWCASSPQGTQVDEEVQFEEKHAQDMQKKEDKASQLIETTSPTLELLMPEQEQDIVTESVEYASWVVGFVAYPQDNENAPGVVLIHERRWLNEHIEDMARVLAMQGYRALAVDLYGWVVPDDFEGAREMSSGLDQEETTANLLAAESYLRENASKVASLWRCLWGKQSLQLSLASQTLDGTVIYYGRLTDDVETLKNINQPVLGIFAENDGWIPPSAVEAFQKWLDEAGVTDYDITIYPWVDHAFANPTWGNYEKQATLDARSKTITFLWEVLSNEEWEKEWEVAIVPLSLEDFDEDYENIDIVMVPEQIVATVTNEWSLWQRSDDAFEYLAGFIFGDNDARDQIAMTSPVTRSKTSDFSYETAFIMPSKRTLENLPEPNNERVSIKSIPSSLQAVWRFSWYVNQERTDVQWKAFQQALENEWIVWYGMPTLAQYDGPWVAASRRTNELRVSLNP